MAKNIFAKLTGQKVLDTEGVVTGTVDFAAATLVVSEKEAAVIRQSSYAIGRMADVISSVRFVEIDENGKETILATASATPKEWAVTYNDGKEHAAETTKFERSEARKPSDTWKDVPLENGARDLGPDLMKLATAALGELGLVERRAASETTGLKVRVEQQSAELAAVIAALRAAGMEQAEIDATLAKAREDATAKVKADAEAKAKAKAEKAAAKPAAKPAATDKPAPAK